jgi:phosphoribosylformimino-5-aminoimidazole carboxamide ribotide isomerase
MRIVPVLDLKGGQIVRGIGGRRDEYRPVVSGLIDSSAPVDVAAAFRDRLGLSELYVADLDAIAGASPARETYTALHALGCDLWVDAGLRVSGQAEALIAAGVARVVAGLETLDGPRELARLCERYRERVVFSLDLKEGRPLDNRSAWGTASAWEVASRAVERGASCVLVLDLARVGGGSGTGTEDLCRRLAGAYPGVEIAAGGGVRGPDDLRRLRTCGVRAVLVASALHDGRLTRTDLAEFAPA